MRFPVLISLAIAGGLALTPARATDSYNYGKHEYVTIRQGLAPNKQFSLASHGEGELGDSDFNLWLMAEPAHRRIMALDNINSDTILDTGAGAFHAFWSKDSRLVGVAHRSSRHEVALDLYRIDGRQAHLIAAPKLFKEVTGRDVTDDDDLRAQISIVEWLGGGRFRLRQFRSFIVPDDQFLKLLGAYGSVGEKLDGGKLYVEFFANAECELLPGDRVRVIDLKPGKHGDSDNWWDP
jgi:hypothetical protein